MKKSIFFLVLSISLFFASCSENGQIISPPVTESSDFIQQRSSELLEVTVFQDFIINEDFTVHLTGFDGEDETIDFDPWQSLSFINQTTYEEETINLEMIDYQGNSTGAVVRFDKNGNDLSNLETNENQSIELKE